MCWSFEVSLVTAAVVYGTAVFLLFRNASRRDRWNATFLLVYGSMQAVDAFLWHLASQEDLTTCSSKNTTITKIGFFIIMAEPLSSLLGRMLAFKQLCSRTEFVLYFVAFLAIPLTCYEFIARGNCKAAPLFALGTKNHCTHVTPQGHLFYGISQDFNGGLACWKSLLFAGEWQQEIPMVLRIFFLVGCVYPYLSMKPLAAGLVNALILTSTWLMGYFSDSHANFWCFANVAQTIVFVLDPYIFSDAFSLPVEAPAKKSRVKISEQRYAKKNVPENLDAIVVGSGIGGLGCAALLSRAGKRVLVLEQHYRAGGCTHTFDELGGNLFDSGIHYVGAKDHIDRLMQFITATRVRFARMGSKADGFKYDEIDLGTGKNVSYQAGTARLRADLIKLYPHEKAGLEKYFRMLDACSSDTDYFVALRALPDWLTQFKGVSDWLFKRFMRTAGRTAAEVANECVQDKQLRALLSGGQLIDWNCPPDEVSFFVVASMMSYYKEGGFYPEHGSHVIAEGIIPVIERGGGKVLCRAMVEEIIVGADGAEGVRMKNGDEHYAPIVISGVGAWNTYNKLLPAEAQAQHQIPRPKLKSSNGHMTAFVSLDNSHEVFDLQPWNIHSYLDLPKFDYDISNMQRAFYERPLEQPGCLVTLTCPSAKDPKYYETYPGTSNVLLLTEAKMEWFDAMEDVGGHGSRSEEYKEFKTKFEAIFLERLYHYYPKCRGHVIRIDIGTPLSTNHYLGTERGESYGLAWDLDRFERGTVDALKAKSNVPNLFLTGEATLFGGYVGALITGYITASKIVGFAGLLKVVAFAQPPQQERVAAPSKASKENGKSKAE